MLKILPFHPADLLSLDIDLERYDPSVDEIDYKHWYHSINTRTDSRYSVWDEKGVVAILFGWFVGRASAEICILVDKRINQIKLRDLKCLKKQILEILESEHRIRKVYRFQALVTSRLPKLQKFMEFLGFKRETILEKFEAGRYDSIVYRRFYGLGVK